MKPFALILILGLISLTLQNEHCSDNALSYEEKVQAHLRKEAILEKALRPYSEEEVKILKDYFMIDDVAYDIEKADHNHVYRIANTLIYASRGDTTYIQINISHVRSTQCFKLEFYKKMFGLNF